jgi:hypothetical protein
MNLKVDLSGSRVMTAKGFARLLVMAAVASGSDPKVFLQHAGKVLTDACPVFTDENKPKAAVWADAVCAELETAIAQGWRS